MNPPALAAYGMTWKYARSETLASPVLPVLEDVSFELARGEVLALLGPNGAGKSTLLKLVAGLLDLRQKGGSGVVRYRGQEISEFDAASRARQVAYVGSELAVDFPLTAFEAVKMGRICHATSGPSMSGESGATASELARRAMERCRCWELGGRDLSELSGGERQRVALARALAQGARTLLLDETLSRMDLDHQAESGKLLRALAAEGWSIILVAHDLNVATEWADTCLILNRGRRVALGPPGEVVTPQNISLLYPGADLEVAPSPTNGTPKVFFKNKR